MQIKITDSASKRIEQLISQNKDPKIGLRISVDGGGCSGFMYNYELVDSFTEEDYIITHQGVKVIVDPISQEFLNGCLVDFIQELGSSYFQITNPKATAKCGCGNSFAV